MKWKNSTVFACLLLLTCFSAVAQMKQYGYKRQLSAPHDLWQRIVLPNGIFGKVSADLSDIRIIGITPKKDTIMAPYLLQEAATETISKDIDFTLINQSHNSSGYYFTFELAAATSINQIKLAFAQPDFDWRIQLQGSHDQHEWFTVLNNYRILSIKNELTHYQFTSLVFPAASYRYFRLFINSKVEPQLQHAQITKQDTVQGSCVNYVISRQQRTEEKQTHQTIITVDLSMPVQVSYLKIHVHDTIDYYRPVAINYVVDSMATEKGPVYEYATLAAGTLHSIEENAFVFNSTICRKLQMVIENHDNQPLKIDSIEVNGYVHMLTARFVEPANWWLVYGNKQAQKPVYDISHLQKEYRQHLRFYRWVTSSQYKQ